MLIGTMHWHEEDKTLWVLLITYDHSKMNRTGDPVSRIIKEIIPCLGRSAHLLVVLLTKPFTGPLPAMSEWFSKHLRKNKKLTLEVMLWPEKCCRESYHLMSWAPAGSPRVSAAPPQRNTTSLRIPLLVDR